VRAAGPARAVQAVHEACGSVEDGDLHACERRGSTGGRPGAELL